MDSIQKTIFILFIFLLFFQLFSCAVIEDKIEESHKEIMSEIKNY